MGRKAAETPRNINHVFDSGMNSEDTVEPWFQKFHCGNKSFENGGDCGSDSAQ